jgi:hypothetical protein
MMVAAFESDFGNGEIKAFLEDICKHLIGKSWEFRCESPPINSKLNSEVITKDSDLDVQESSSASASPSAGHVTSDVLIYLTSQPCFVLSIECKKGQDTEDTALLQLLKQCLSHMHYQLTIFGILVTPLYWQLMVVQKKDQDNSIRITQLRESFRGQENPDTETVSFNIQSVENLLNWIGRCIEFKHRNRSMV